MTAPFGRVARGPIPKDRHGTRYCYIYYRCRCDECRAANTLYSNKQRAERFARLKKDPTLAEHGLRSTYTNWGCRCEDCTRVHSEACRRYAKTGSTSVGRI